MNQRITAGEDIISCLLVNPFSSRHLNERTILIQEGWPKPKLVLKTRDMVFQDHWYEKTD